MRIRRRSAWAAAVSTSSRAVGSAGASSGRCRVPRTPMIDVRGVRSSWETTETNSDFNSASSAIFAPSVDTSS